MRWALKSVDADAVSDSAGEPRGDLLDEPDIAVGISEGAERSVAGALGVWAGPPFPVEARQPGPHPERTSYRSFSCFTDPDGNTWLVQEVTTRLWSAPRPDERR